MTMYDRTDPDGYREIDRFDGGVGWLAHPDETGKRASHLVESPDGVWLFDPLDVPCLDELIAEFGELAGIAVLSNYHARDADAIAARHDVPIYLPTWLRRAESRLSGSIEPCETALGRSGFRLTRYHPVPGYDEAIAYRERDGTLYVPDALGTAPFYIVGDERLACYGVLRLFPPQSLFEQFDPERILVGHGEGIFTDASEALTDAFEGARRRFPTVLRRHGRTQLWGMLSAVFD